jgi:N-methylhydantoinase A/oxoprolinase/acetone carboxylase beta subunit
MAWQIGVDVGGTFTDLLALDPERGVFRVAKVLSTPEDQSIGFIAGLAELKTDLAAVIALVHGTTVATARFAGRGARAHRRRWPGLDAARRDGGAAGSASLA